MVNKTRVVVTPIKTYKTMSALSLILYSKINVAGDIQDVAFLGINKDSAQHLFEKYMKIVNLLPEFMIHDVISKNIRIKPTPFNIEQADNMGRSGFANLFMVDDYEYVNHIKTLISASSPYFKVNKSNLEKKIILYYLLGY